MCTFTKLYMYVYSFFFFVFVPCSCATQVFACINTQMWAGLAPAWSSGSGPLFAVQPILVGRWDRPKIDKHAPFCNLSLSTLLVVVP